jgi:Carboxypeptidase regulatory-like domain
MKIFAKIFVFCLSVSALVWGQGGTAQIHGIVQDASGAAVPGAEVKATQTATGFVRTINSEADGSYVLSNLPIGPYHLEVSKEGFNKFVQDGIVLQVNSDPLISASLKVGAVSEQVVVEANATQVETRNSTVGQVIENQRIVDLPLNGRNVTDLIALSGAAVQVGTTRQSMGGGVNPTPLLQVAGGLAYATAYNLDGANHINPNSGGALPLPFPDALQEFKVDTSGASIDQGKSASVSAVTKSGTNQFHGDAFEFLRNDAVNAHPYFAQTPSTLKRNQFGGVLGGPIKKDKIFFFGGYQETTLRQDPTNNETWLPTADMLNGDWTTYTSPACNNGRAVNMRGGFVGNKIDPAKFSKTALNIMNMTLAQAPTPDQCGHLYYGIPSSTNEYQGVGRVDYQLSPKHTLFARYQDLVDEQPPAYTLTHDILNANQAGADNYIQDLVIGSTYVFSPTIVNAFRISGNFARARNVGVDTFSVCDAGAITYCGNAPHRTVISISNGPSLGSSYASPFDGFNTTLFSLNDDVSVIKGAHQISFGFVGALSRNTSNFQAISPGRYTFTTQFTGVGLGDFMTGQVTQLVQTATNHMDITSINPTAYFVDTWKATRKLTVSMSLRWDPFLPQYLKHGGIANFDFARFNAGTTTQQYKYGPSGWYYPGDPGTPGWRGSFNKPWDFAPRLGLAWDPTGSGKTSIRASFAYTYAQVLNYWRQDPNDQNPWSNGTRRTGVSLDSPWQGYTYIDPTTGATVSGVPFPAIFAKGFTQDGDYTSTPYNIQAPQTSSWNLSVQRQITNDWLVSAAYLGSMTTHIWLQDQPNPGQIIGPPATSCPAGSTIQTCSSASNLAQRRLFTLLRPNDVIRQGEVALLYDGGNMSYNGLLLSATKRLSKGTSVQMNYTWSHCLSDMVDAISSGPDAGEVSTMPGNRHFDYGNCDADRRQIFNLTGVAQSPQFSGRAMRLIGSGWTLSGIYRWSSGAPLNLLAGSDRALHGDISFFSGATFQRANQLMPNDQAYVSGGGGPLSQWLNPSAFAVPALGTVGNYGRDNLVYPSIWGLDMALSRAFRLTESQHLEIRADAFNVSNSFHPGPPPTSFTPGGNAFTNASSPLFGQIRTAADTRIMQFAMKYVF